VTQKEVSTKAKLAILSAGLMSFVGILVETSMNVTFPTLISELHVSLSTVQWLTTAYLLLVTIVMSTTAFVLKRFAPKAIFLFAAGMCFVGGLLCLFAPTFWILLIGRLLQATATGLATPLMFQLIFTHVPIKSLGLYTGLASVIISLAPALGPTYGGILTSTWSWRAIFVGILPILALVTIFGSFTIDGSAQRVGEQKFDFIGALLLAGVFTMVLFTFSSAGSNGFLSPAFLLWILADVVVIAVFVAYAIKGKRHLFDYSILKRPVLRLRLFNYFGLQFTNIGLSFLLPLFAQTVLGATAMTAGLMLLPGALVGMVIAPFAGRFYDHHGPQGILTFSISMLLLSLVLFFAFTDSLTIVTVAILFTVLRVGFNSGFGVAISDGSLYVDGSQKADQNSMFSMMQQYAGSLGTSVLSAVVSAAALSTDSKTSMYIGGKADFALLIVLAVALFASILYTHLRYLGKESSPATASMEA
jgi:EmrB/QacA subfamily drug resistance transporter